MIAFVAAALVLVIWSAWVVLDELLAELERRGARTPAELAELLRRRR